MAQVNNHAESLSRELRKLKNIKSIDFRGLLSGNTESYVNLYRHLFCENSLVFSRYIVDKGYDLSGLSDYKLMEAIYKLMRDLFNLKPPINQNQFFSQGFTQRKLEMSTMLAAQIRKIINEQNVSAGKKTVHTQSLIKSSLKRPNSAPKPIRVSELGDEESRAFSVLNNTRSKKSRSNHKSANKTKTKSITNYKDRITDDHVNNVTSDSEQSNPMYSNNYQAKSNSNHSVDNNYAERSYGTQKYSALPSNYRGDHADMGSVSAYEASPIDQDPSYMRTQQFNGYSRMAAIDNSDQRTAYDVKQYTPRSNNEDDGHTMIDRGQGPVTLDSVMQKFDTVLAKMTLLESRVQRIESKLDNSSKHSQDHQAASHASYPGQNNHNYMHSTHHHFTDSTKPSAYDSNTFPARDSRNVISDFESNFQSHKTSNLADVSYQPYLINSGLSSMKADSDRSYQPYDTNVSRSAKSDFDKPYQTYSSHIPGYYSSHINTDIDHSGGHKYISSVTTYSNKANSDINNSRENSFRGNNSIRTKTSQPNHKLNNGIPPVHPTMKRSDDSGFEENRHTKSNLEKGDSYIQLQTDRIASLLSDTQKMLKISDEEL